MPETDSLPNSLLQQETFDVVFGLNSIHRRRRSGQLRYVTAIPSGHIASQMRRYHHDPRILI